MKKIVVGLLICIGAASAFGQKKLHRKAEKHFHSFEFVTAAHLYERILTKNANDQLAATRLEQCYKALSFHEPVFPASAAKNELTPTETNQPIQPISRNRSR